MDLNRLSELRKLDTKTIESSLYDLFRGKMAIVNINTYIVAAYVLYVARNAGYGELPRLDTFVENEIKEESLSYYIKDELSNVWELLNSTLYKHDILQLEAFILFAVSRNGKSDGSFETPSSLIELAETILDILPGEQVGDFGTGRLTFITSSFIKNPNASYYGNDIATDVKVIASIRAQLLGGDIKVIQEDMFEMYDNQRKFDKIFSNYPFGMRVRDLRGGISFLERNKETFPQIEKATSSDWFFNSLIISSLKEDGKAIGIMTNGSTWNSIDRPIREYFLRKGYIECVIALPDKLFSATDIPTTMVVLSHGNKNVKLVDATGLCLQERRQNIIRKEDVETIYKSYIEETKYTKVVEIGELQDNEFVINPLRYINNDVTIENGVPLESLVKSFTRGAPLTASELDKMVSKEPTLMQYLMLVNIKDGIIDEELPYLAVTDNRLEKYYVKKNNLLLSKNGYPFKVAIASVKENQNIIANGNLYIIELDEDKVEPYYLKAFLESEQGIASLKRIAVGAAIPNIALESLRKLLIPMVSLERQKQIAQEYLATLDEIALLKLKIKKATNSLRNIFTNSEVEE